MSALHIQLEGAVRQGEPHKNKDQPTRQDIAVYITKPSKLYWNENQEKCSFNVDRSDENTNAQFSNVISDMSAASDRVGESLHQGFSAKTEKNKSLTLQQGGLFVSHLRK